MTGAAAPLQLGELLHASSSPAREAAWEELITEHTRLILAVARSFGGDNDQIMDRYAFILGKLRESDFRRLRAFRSDAGAKFSTWLTVASRRLCLDEIRSRYGRARVTSDDERTTLFRRMRRELMDSGDSDSADVDQLPDHVKGADEQAEIEERDSLLSVELMQLSANDRLLLALRFEDSLPASRIATVMGFSNQFTVYHQLASICARLRTVLQAKGIDSVDI